MNLESIIGDVGSPAFVYDLSILDERVKTLNQVGNHAADNFAISYSYKTNPALARHLHDLGCGMQVTSLSHLEDAIEVVGTKQDNCFFCTAALTREQVESAEDFAIVINSATQMELINAIGESLQKVIRVLVRVDAGTRAETPFGTRGALLGIPLIEALATIERMPWYPWLQLVGIHNHFASQNCDESWIDNARVLAQFVVSLPHSANIQVLNCGGGFPIEYVGANAPAIGSIFAAAFLPMMQTVRQRFPDIKLVVEPGRWLVGPTGFLVTKVVDVMPGGAVIDASLFAAFPDRFLSGMTLQLPIIDKLGGGKRYRIRGSSPASVDFFGDYDDMEELQIGDHLVFGMAGAYAASMGSNFSGVDRPAEYLLRDGRLTAV